jgi:UDP-3-O-[3-hydroxymyristoyl] glucosamine N-acyltransferase
MSEPQFKRPRTDAPGDDRAVAELRPGRAAVSAVRLALTVRAVAARLDGTLRGPAGVEIHGLATPTDATPGELTFIGAALYARQWPTSRAAAAVVAENLVSALDASDPRPVIVVRNIDVAMAVALELFGTPEPAPDEGVHPAAFVHRGAQLGARVRIGPHVSVDRGARIGDDVVLHAGVRVYADAVIGAGSVLHANVVIRHGCTLGRRVILHQGVAIGADGFGYRPGPTGRGLVKLPHIGNVVLEDDVEIGANSCVDRGKFGATVIGAGTKIDNLCQVGHNCRVGRGVVIAGCTGIGGSVTIGDGVQIGGAVGLSDHVKIGPGARVAGGSIVYHDVPAGATWLGVPAGDAGAVKRQWAALRRLPEFLGQLRGGSGWRPRSRR